MKKFYPADEEAIFHIENFELSAKHSKVIYETKDAFYSFMRDGIFRAKKKSFKPVIRKTEEVVLDLAACSIFVNFDTLMDLGEQGGFPIWELNDSHAIITGDLNIYAKKKREFEV